VCSFRRVEITRSSRKTFGAPAPQWTERLALPIPHATKLRDALRSTNGLLHSTSSFRHDGDSIGATEAALPLSKPIFPFFPTSNAVPSRKSGKTACRQFASNSGAARIWLRLRRQGIAPHAPPRALLRSTLTAHPPSRCAAKELLEKWLFCMDKAAVSRRLSNMLTYGCLIG
jgi:hypothetical protein